MINLRTTITKSIVASFAALIVGCFVFPNVANGAITSSPTIFDDYVLDGAWNKTDPTVTLNPEDVGGSITKVMYCNGAGCNPSTGITLALPYTLTYFNEGKTTVRYQAWDNEGNFSKIEEFSVWHDCFYPTVTYSAILEGSGASFTGQYANDAVIVTLTADDTLSWSPTTPVSGNKDIFYCIDYAGQSCDDKTTFIKYEAPLRFSQEGGWRDGHYWTGTMLKWYAVDNVGNESYFGSKYIRIDLTRPSVFVSDPYYVGSSSKRIEVYPSDDFSGVSTTSWELLSDPAGVTLTPQKEIYENFSKSAIFTAEIEKTYKVRYTVTDVAGNVFNKEFDVIWDSTQPTAVLSNLPSNPTNNTWPYIDVGGVGVISYKYKLDDGIYSGEDTYLKFYVNNSLTEGLHTLSVIGKDAAGNWQSESNATQFTWTIDLTPPAISGAVDYTVYTHPITITYGDGSGLYYNEKQPGWVWPDWIAFTSGTTFSADGVYCIYVKDAAGNESFLNFTIDRSPPVVSLIGDNPFNIYQGSSWTDPGANALDEIDGDLNSRIKRVSQVNTSIVGDYIVTYSVTDNAGNVGTATRTVHVFSQYDPPVVVVAPPALTITPPAPVITPPAPVVFVPAPTPKVLGATTFHPVIKNLTLVKRAYSYKLNGKTIKITPFGNDYKGVIWAKSIDFGSDGKIFLFLNSGAYKKGQIKVFQANGKLLKAYNPYGGFATSGLNATIISESNDKVYLAVGTQKSGTTVKTYQITAKKFISLNSLTTTTKAGNVQVSFQKLYKTQYGLVTMKQGDKKTLKVWKLDLTKNRFVEDKKISKTKIKI